MKTTTRSLLLGATLLAASLRFAAAAPSSARTIEITANDTLRFNVTRIEAAPGESLHIVLHNAGTVPKEVMGHNWVLLTPGENPDAYAAAAINAKADDYEPAALATKIVAKLPLLGPGETADVTFKVPSVPGRYVYMCSFPAHCSAGMRGELIVR